MERYNKAQAARYIGIAKQTLYTWLHEVGQVEQETFTRKELDNLAGQHGRTIPTPEVARLRADLEILRADLDALAERVRELEQDRPKRP